MDLGLFEKADSKKFWYYFHFEPAREGFAATPVTRTLLETVGWDNTCGLYSYILPKGTQGTLSKMREQSFRVAVVGGGLSGLSAAEVLSSHFGKENVIVLEAASNLGGRIENVSGLAPWPVEIGPEFLHGTQNSSMKKLVDEMGCVQRELDFPDYYYIGHEGRLLSHAEAEEHPDIQQVHDLFKAVVDEELGVADTSMADFLRKKGVNSTGMSFAQAIYGNDFGCSLEKLGVYECIQEANQWIYGDTYIILDRPLSSVVNHISRDLNVRVNWVVKQVKHLKNGIVQLHGHDGRVVKAEHVILTVPVTILQQGVISFDPPLPESKVRAAKMVGMSNIIKVVMAFSNKFWPANLFDVVCSGCFLPEVWMTEYPQATSSMAADNNEGGYPSSPLGQYTVVGFIAGDQASRVAQMHEVEVFRQSLDQLDKMFGTGEGSDHSSAFDGELRPTGVSASSKGSGTVLLRKDVIKPSIGSSRKTRPASYSFSGGIIVNWANRSFIRGGYSHPSVNAEGARSELAKPFGNIFFAGEATHPGVNPCLQAAIDTGRRAAEEVIGVCKRRSAL